MRKWLLVALSLLLINISSANYVTDLEDTLIKQEGEIIYLEGKVTKLEAEKKARYIVRIPFTNWGITKDAVVGGAVVFIIMI